MLKESCEGLDMYGEIWPREGRFVECVECKTGCGNAMRGLQRTIFGSNDDDE